MKTTATRIACCLAGCAITFAAASLSGCKTSESGIKSAYVSQWATVAGNTMNTTDAARGVLEDLKLQRVDSRSTEVDGWAKAYNADNNEISVKVEKAGPDTSKVRVTVGPVGDPALGTDIINRIRQRLGH